MSKQAMREETERLVKEAMERKAIAIKQGKIVLRANAQSAGVKSRLGGQRAGAVHVQAMRRKATDILRRLRPRTIALSIAVREAIGIE